MLWRAGRCLRHLSWTYQGENNLAAWIRHTHVRIMEFHSLKGCSSLLNPIYATMRNPVFKIEKFLSGFLTVHFYAYMKWLESFFSLDFLLVKSTYVPFTHFSYEVLVLPWIKYIHTHKHLSSIIHYEYFTCFNFSFNIIHILLFVFCFLSF